MVLRKFALARSIELQFFDGATKTTGLAVLLTFCTKTQSLISTRLGFAYCAWQIGHRSAVAPARANG